MQVLLARDPEAEAEEQANDEEVSAILQAKPDRPDKPERPDKPDD
jgi:hypothetical protein